VARDLKNKGFTNIHLLAGGFDAWQQAGYPLESKEGWGKSSRWPTAGWKA